MVKKNKPLFVLTIAGSDSGAGAGIQADARTIHASGGYALTAIAAVTAQNTRGVTAWRAVSPKLIEAQIDAVMNDFKVAAVKTGLLSGTAAVRAVVRALERHPRLPLVVDPVIGSTSGTRFLPTAAVRVLVRELLPRAALVTPNWPEVEILSGLQVRSHLAAEAAAWRIIALSGCSAVLVKGGHAPGKDCRDCLVTADGRVRWFVGPRVATRNTHGTGCVLSAAIATRLARGEKIATAVAGARAFLTRSLKRGMSIRWGRGHGPAFAG